ncbi:hypothetical protein SAMD00019534_036030 [Acytostelium subglobosum LB1]|uniref:hypothetical protein n=1 Tax=Acytostelium subglobosum LB1 TaxID=1410327 RepID=UPI000644F5C4|nr:hypothetical protein SAMD00019534_036030 [Acytostelium subglobosum LB1]GAM20428.1 hypothetical protein SAMD00019534_036030 [Acytostelium subglobosum LB1]|eukprot:XP_012759949.1 hypothetical protein SAMD00019534_036030 [Acytostelium subglobosum LB1]
MSHNNQLIAAAAGAVTLTGLVAMGLKRPHPYGQTVEVGNKVVGEGRARRNVFAEKELVDHIPEEQVYTIYDSFIAATQKFRNKQCFGQRNVGSNGELNEHFDFITYGEFAGHCETLFQGLCELGLKPKSRIGVFSRNRIEWLITQYACYLQNNIIVSFYETLGVDSLAFVSKHAEIELAFCSKETLSKMKELALKVRALRTIICYDNVPDSVREDFRDNNINLYTLDQIYAIGKLAKIKHRHVPPTADDLCTIMYTSGTTGDPKGVMITHRNVIAVVNAVKKYIDYINETDAHYSYLPYAHIMERIIVFLAYHYGGRIGIFCGDITKILPEIKILRPTLFVGVPRVFERIKAGVFKEISKQRPLRRSIFMLAYKLKYLSILYGFKMPLLEAFLNFLVFAKLKLALGGQVRVILSGSAPLSADTEIFLRVCFSCVVVQGYGLTETCGGTAVKLLQDSSVGSLGPPFVSVEAKLVDVPELNYYTTSNPPCGEVHLRGPSVAIGYFKDDAKTQQDFKDGWFATGDIGRWNRDGSLSIIDRKKNIFKLSQGEYVAVERVEGALLNSQWVAQVFIYGDSQKANLVAIVHPHPDKVEEWAKLKGIVASFEQLCSNRELNQIVLKDMESTARQTKLFGFEIPKRVHLISEAFSDVNGLLTPSFKLKRQQIKDRYKHAIDDMYRNLD